MLIVVVLSLVGLIGFSLIAYVSRGRVIGRVMLWGATVGIGMLVTVDNPHAQDDVSATRRLLTLFACLGIAACLEHAADEVGD